MFIFFNEKPHAGCITNNPATPKKKPDKTRWKTHNENGKTLLHKTGKMKWNFRLQASAKAEEKNKEVRLNRFCSTIIAEIKELLLKLAENKRHLFKNGRVNEKNLT